MFERFSDQARRVILLAREEAGRRQHGGVGAEHVLLASVGAGDGLAVRVLHRLGVRLDVVETEIERVLAAEPARASREIPFTTDALRLLAEAINEARDSGANRLDTDHLLLGALREGRSSAARVLESQGIRLDDARQAVLALADDRHQG